MLGYGATGVLHGLDTQEELDAFAAAGGQGGYAVVVPIALYSRYVGRVSMFSIIQLTFPAPDEIWKPSATRDEYQASSWSLAQTRRVPTLATWNAQTASTLSTETVLGVTTSGILAERA